MRPARHRCRLEAQGLDQARFRYWRRRHGRTLVDLVPVVDQPDVNTPLVRCDQRAADDVSGLVLQAEVVERELQRLTCAVDERGDLLRDAQRRLTAVGERVDLDQAQGRRLRAANLQRALRRTSWNS